MKKIVIDSNVAVSLAIPAPYTPQARQQMGLWVNEGRSLFAPSLWAYEVISTLRKFTVARVVTPDDAEKALKFILALNIRQVPLDTELYLKILDWANRLRQGQAYDAAYLTLAEALEAEFWTADKRLANRAEQLGISWVYVVE